LEREEEWEVIERRWNVCDECDECDEWMNG
jgi:hypothetical protein